MTGYVRYIVEVFTGEHWTPKQFIFYSEEAALRDARLERERYGSKTRVMKVRGEVLDDA